jgi:hypothetical protein
MSQKAGKSESELLHVLVRLSRRLTAGGLPQSIRGADTRRFLTRLDEYCAQIDGDERKINQHGECTVLDSKGAKQRQRGDGRTHIICNNRRRGARSLRFRDLGRDTPFVGPKGHSYADERDAEKDGDKQARLLR